MYLEKVLEKICLREKQLYIARWNQDYACVVQLHQELNDLQKEKEDLQEYWDECYAEYHQLRIRKEILEQEKDYSGEEWNRIVNRMEELRRVCVGEKNISNSMECGATG